MPPLTALTPRQYDEKSMAAGIISMLASEGSDGSGYRLRILHSHLRCGSHLQALSPGWSFARQGLIAAPHPRRDGHRTRPIGQRGTHTVHPPEQSEPLLRTTTEPSSLPARSYRASGVRPTPEPAPLPTWPAREVYPPDVVSGLARAEARVPGAHEGTHVSRRRGQGSDTLAS
jgi:hypothetical protein